MTLHLFTSQILFPSSYQLERVSDHQWTISVFMYRGATDNNGPRSFSQYGPRLWNKVPLAIRASPTDTVFKQKLKTHLF